MSAVVFLDCSIVPVADGAVRNRAVRPARELQCARDAGKLCRVIREYDWAGDRWHFEGLALTVALYAAFAVGEIGLIFSRQHALIGSGKVRGILAPAETGRAGAERSARCGRTGRVCSDE